MTQQMADILKPLEFHGDLVVDGEKVSGPIAPYFCSKLNYHLEYCCVIGVVRIAANGWLNDDPPIAPDQEPWFLIYGIYAGVSRYFIVNRAEQYLPVVHEPLGRCKAPYCLMNPAAYQEELWVLKGNSRIYEWDKFSKLDLLLVRHAIATHISETY